MSEQHLHKDDLLLGTMPVVFKVLSRVEWEKARVSGIYLGSADDLRDGFIHFSTAQQLEGTVAKYFRGKADHLLVAFDSEALGADLKWEASRGGMLFPHLYGPLPCALALWQRPLELGTDGVPIIRGEWLEC